MNIIFNKLIIQNFLSFDYGEFNLSNNGYVLIDGINNNPDDNANSNGSGKSTIFEALCWCLTGQTIRGSKEVCNLFKQEDASVTISICIDGISYKIIRTKNFKNSSTSLKIYRETEDISGKGVRDSENILNQLFPDLNMSLINSVIILGQGLPLRFTNNTPSGRKEILEKLSKSDFMIEDVKNRIANRKINLNNELRNIEDNILRLNTEKSSIEKSIIEKENKLKEFENIKEKQENITTLENTIKMVSTNVDILSKSIQEKEIEKELNSSKLTEAIFNKNKEQEEIKLSYTEILDTVNENLKSLEADKLSINREIKKKKSITDICPTCGQKIPNVIKPSIDNELEELKKIEENIAVHNCKLQEIYTKIDQSVNSIEDKYITLLDNLKKSNASIEFNLISERSELSKTSSTLIDYNRKYEKAKAELEYFLEMKDSIENDLVLDKNRLDNLENEILYNNNDKQIIEQRINIINKFNTIVTRDFRGYLLLSVIDFINMKSKEYCMDIFNTDKINFTLDGNNISISYNGKEYENLSGGEKQKIDLIVQFAIRDMLCTYLNFSSNILVVDELFDNLDSIGCEKILTFISSKLKDVNTIYIITHHADISIPYDHKITVVKNSDNVSNVMFR